MKASELIVALQKAIEKHGDLPVEIAVPVEDDAAYMEVNEIQHHKNYFAGSEFTFLLRE